MVGPGRARRAPICLRRTGSPLSSRRWTNGRSPLISNAWTPNFRARPRCAFSEARPAPCSTSPGGPASTSTSPPRTPARTKRTSGRRAKRSAFRSIPGYDAQGESAELENRHRGLERGRMTSRDQLQTCYEIAFHPPRLDEVWRRIQRSDLEDLEALGECIDTALLLHQALPTATPPSARSPGWLSTRRGPGPSARCPSSATFGAGSGERVPLRRRCQDTWFGTSGFRPSVAGRK